MFVNIDIYSKNIKSLNQFTKLLFNTMSVEKLNYKSVYKYFYKKNSRKVFTVLKSPHVNKKSQEQFEYFIFSNKVMIETFQIFKILIVLKKLQQVTGFDVAIKIKFQINSLKNSNCLLRTLRPTSYKLKLQKSKNTCDKSFMNYLKLFDAYGSLEKKSK